MEVNFYNLLLALWLRSSHTIKYFFHFEFIKSSFFHSIYNILICFWVRLHFELLNLVCISFLDYCIDIRLCYWIICYTRWSFRDYFYFWLIFEMRLRSSHFLQVLFLFVKHAIYIRICCRTDSNLTWIRWHPFNSLGSFNSLGFLHHVSHIRLSCRPCYRWVFRRKHYFWRLRSCVIN